MPTTTRYYFPRSGSVPASPAFGSGWEVTTDADRFPLSTSSAHDASNATISRAETDASVIDRLHRQYVADSTLSAGIVAGTFTLVIQGSESTNGADHYLQCIIRVVSGDGSVERGVLYAGQTPTTPDSDPAAPNGEFSQAPVQTRVISAFALSAVTAQAGDRLVVELGYRACNTTTTSTSASLRMGAVSAQSDYAATAGTTTDNRPWIDIARTNVPNVPTSLGETHDHDSIDFTWAAPSGGDAPTGYKVRIAAGSWVDVGNVLAHTFSGLTASTAYTMDVLAYNAAGDGPSAALSTTTDAAPVVAATPDPAQQRVPLTVRIGDKHITREVSGLQFRKEAIGGLKSISLRLARPLDRFDTNLAPLSEVYIFDGRTAEIIAQGRLTDPGRSASAGDGQQWDMVAFPPGLTDRTFPYVLVDTSLESFRRFGISSTKNATTGTDERGEDEPSLMVTAEEGKTVSTSWQGGMVSRVMRDAGMTLGRVRCDIDSGVTSGDYALRLVTRIGDAGGTVADSATASTTAGVLAATRVGTIPASHDTVTFDVARSGSGTTGAEAHWFEFWNVVQRAVLKDVTGADITASGYSQNYVLAHEVINDLLGRVLDQIDGANSVVNTGGTYQIDQLSYPDGVTAEQILADLMALEPAYRYWIEPDGAGGYVLHWEPWPTTVRYEVTLNGGGDFPSSSQEIYNEVTVRWRGVNGRTRTVTRTLACQILDDAGVTRSTIIDAGDEIGSALGAARLGDNFLAEHNVPANAGTINIDRPIRDLLTGRMVRPHEIEPGNLIRVRGVESYPDALNPDSRDGLTIFRVWSVTYNSDSDSAACELDIPSRSTTNALVKLAKRRNRKR